jgi:4-alpha-glucanotransferase
VPWRLAQLRAACAGFRARATAGERAALAAWREAQAYWLDDYALFMALETRTRRRPGGSGPPAPLRVRDAAALVAARCEHADEIAFWQFVQWCFDEQCTRSRPTPTPRHARSWATCRSSSPTTAPTAGRGRISTELDDDFQPTVVAGVPPDDLGPLGQRWGNPLYRWDRMAAEGYAWWIARVHRALDQADVFRIDHFRGFAGYYEIPASSPTAHVAAGARGRARRCSTPSPPNWAAADRRRRPGLITPDVIELRDGCGFPGMKILQFAFGGDGDARVPAAQLRAHCVVYTGTHDNDTVRGWWQQAAKPRERPTPAPTWPAVMHDVHWAMIRAAWNSVANLAVCRCRTCWAWIARTA